MFSGHHFVNSKLVLKLHEKNQNEKTFKKTRKLVAALLLLSQLLALEPMLRLCFAPSSAIAKKGSHCSLHFD
jgi:hypothetical protein